MATVNIDVGQQLNVINASNSSNLLTITSPQYTFDSSSNLRYTISNSPSSFEITRQLTTENNGGLNIVNGSLVINFDSTLRSGDYKHELFDVTANRRLFFGKLIIRPSINHLEVGSETNPAPSLPVVSVNGKSGVVVLNTDDIDEGTNNLYYTEDRVSNNSNVQANTGKRSYPQSDEDKLSNIADNANNYVLPNDVVQDSNYVHTDNNFTDALEQKLNNTPNSFFDGDYDSLSNKPTTITTQQANDISSNNTHRNTTTGNPHNVTATNVGLGNVDNTSDADKPVSTAQQTEIDTKLDKDINFTDVSNDYTILQTDFSKRLFIDASADISVTIPVVSGSFTPTVKRTFFQVFQDGDSDVTITGATGVIVENVDDQFKIAGDNGMIDIYYKSANTWVITGRTKA